ncbi:UNVERIFIED_CONTAM: Fam20c, partial [Trichonephila clavipes]
KLHVEDLKGNKSHYPDRLGTVQWYRLEESPEAYINMIRCPPVVGRKTELKKENSINHKSKSYNIKISLLMITNKQIFIPAKNICFYGHCRSYCDTSHAICGRPDTVEASLAALLPPDALASRQRWRNPWRRSYRKRQKAVWEEDNNYCKVVRENSMYDNTKRLADIVDMAILDFLIGNMDRHHYETFKIFGNDSFILHLDQGRGFGRPNHDELSILAPLQQCCFLHFKTFHRLVELQQGEMKLSTLMRCSLYKDPLNPVLLDSHLKALDRRLEIVLQTIRKCIKIHSKNNE